MLEYDVKTEHWKDYNDPDGETEMVLMKDQGLIHEITTSVSYVDKILWVATYFGASRYDGRYWHNFLQKDSGLPSNFLNQVKGVDGNRAWFSTDKGLAYYDGTNWAVYRPALDTHKPEMLVRDAAGVVKQIPVQTAPAHNYILGVDFQGDDLWVATAKGLSHGIRQKSSRRNRTSVAHAQDFTQEMKSIRSQPNERSGIIRRSGHSPGREAGHHQSRSSQRSLRLRQRVLPRHADRSQWSHAFC